MIKIFSGLASLFVYLAMATVLFEGASLIWAWQQGHIDQHKLKHVAAILYGLEPDDLKDSLQDNLLANTKLTHSEIRHYRSKMTLDQDLRESSLTGSVDDFKRIDVDFSERLRRFERIQRDFEKTIAQLRGAATDKALNEVRETIKSLKPEQAADQVVRMLELSRTSGEPRYRDDMVIILKTLPEATLRKLLAEFKADNQAPYLYDMLTQIRLGLPDIEAIRETRAQLKQYRQRFPDPEVP